VVTLGKILVIIELPVDGFSSSFSSADFFSSSPEPVSLLSSGGAGESLDSSG
jgi:hypothetical protein